MRRIELLLLALVFLAAACGRGPRGSRGPGGELETVEVAPPPDASASLAGDEVERRREGGGLAGILPSDFPRDLPLPLPASLIDTERGGGEVAILLASPSSCGALREAHRLQLLAAGWREEGAGSFRQGGRRAAVAFQDSRPGCHVRIAVRGG
ncbi:MAG: hypothetical protein KJ058_12515 [Thermoanaerobaculia bacterium]|nr:hypothetical protein [Thermoanaerobaculia bacterium]